MKVTWLPGPPPGRGTYWIAISGSWASLVEIVRIEPALIHRDRPDAPLLVKLLSGIAYPFEPMRKDIHYHAAVEMPEAPWLHAWRELP